MCQWVIDGFPTKKKMINECLNYLFVIDDHQSVKFM